MSKPPFHPLRKLASLLTVTCASLALSAAASASATPGTSAPSGKVTSVGTKTFSLKTSSGKTIKVDTVSGSTYQLTVTATVRTGKVGSYVAALGSVSGGELHAVDVAFVPQPPSFVPQYEVTSTPGGTEYFGKIVSLSGGVATISTGSGQKRIDLASATHITLTTATTFKAIKVGETVEVNGPEQSSTLYTGHQLNLGLTPSVVGQFD